MGINNSQTTFKNEFDLTERDLDQVEIKETYSKDNCFVWDKGDSSKSYNSFILKKNSKSKYVCEIKFYKSSKTQKYLPRPSFQRQSLNGDITKTKSGDKVVIRFDDSETAIKFWTLIGFLTSYKDLVDTGGFQDNFKMIAKDSYVIEFKAKDSSSKLKDLKELMELSNFSASDLKSITFEQRKKSLKGFYYLLKDLKIDSIPAREHYRTKYNVKKGEEYIWHHFLQENDWILGLNVDARFIIDFLDEQKVGAEDSKGKKSPVTDILGVTDFTTLIELKHSSTNIFKVAKSKGRANTWDFTSDFIEGISQCLGQKFELDKTFNSKDFLKEDGTRLDKSDIQSIDPKAIILLGNKKREFPINDLNDDNLLKNKTLQRFRRNNRNLDVLTFDELFERAFQIMYSQKLKKNWYWEDEKTVFEN
jgi:hypothetical protein